jgi:hypothetical protein
MEQLVSLISLGDGSTLTLDFTTGVLDSRLTFTRASTTATYINSSGYVTTAGTNVPRFDHDPTTLAPRGLLVEGTATNLMCWSESFAQSGGTNNWQTRENVTLGTLTTSPDNSTNAYPINETTTNGVHRQTTYFTTGLSGAYSWSIWAKCVDSGTPRRLYINAITALGVGALFDLTASGDLGTAVNVAGTAGNRAGTWVKYPNGWYRCTVVGTRAADAAMFLQINRSSSSTASDDAFAGSTNNGIIMWGSMLEAGSGASSYIPTGASTATRNPDNCSIHDTTTSGNLSWFKTATQGTFYVEAFKRTAGTTFAGAIIGTRANSGQDFLLYQAVGNNWLSLNWGASEYVTNYSTLSSPFLIKAAVAFSPRTGTPTVADSLVSINGANSALNTTPNVALPFSSDLFCVGARGSASGTVPSQNYAEVAIRRIKFFPTAMTAAQLNAMTTL